MFLKRFRRLINLSTKFTIFGFLLFFFSGYYPVLDFPPARSTKVLAEEKNLQIQKDEIIASSFPQPVQLPHPGFLSNRFSRWHPGIDIAASLGMEVHPITGGVVEDISLGFWGYGNHIIVAHPNGFKSLYGHMGKVIAKIGQQVSTETPLGEIGMTGFSSGPHTHLEVTLHGRYIDPLLILPEISDIQKPEYLTKK